MTIVTYKKYVQDMLGGDQLVKSRKSDQYRQLMVDALKFIKQNIPEGKQAVSFGIMQFTEGLTKWFKVLQKDYPNFVANYYFDFVNVPEKCKQLLNIILCAVPQHFLA